MVGGWSGGVGHEEHVILEAGRGGGVIETDAYSVGEGRPLFLSFPLLCLLSTTGACLGLPPLVCLSRTLFMCALGYGFLWTGLGSSFVNSSSIFLTGSPEKGNYSLGKNRPGS